MKLRGHTDNIRALLIDSSGRFVFRHHQSSLIDSSKIMHCLQMSGYDDIRCFKSES